MIDATKPVTERDHGGNTDNGAAPVTGPAQPERRSDLHRADGGPPFETSWWWVMAAILVAAFAVPLAYARAVDWVIDGYRANDGG